MRDMREFDSFQDQLKAMRGDNENNLRNQAIFRIEEEDEEEKDRPEMKTNFEDIELAKND